MQSINCVNLVMWESNTKFLIWKYDFKAISALFKQFMSYPPLRKNCPYSELFWPVFSCIRTEYGEIQSIYSHSVQIQENPHQNNSKNEHFPRSGHFIMCDFGAILALFNKHHTYIFITTYSCKRYYSWYIGHSYLSHFQKPPVEVKLQWKQSSFCNWF